MSTVTEHVAGRDLDALVAEKVLGRDGSDGGLHITPPAYSTEIAAAWEVVERLRGTHYLILEAYKERSRPAWLCFFGDSEGATGQTAPLAICRAALKTVGL